MSDHLLRLAKLMLRLAGDVLSETDPNARNLHAELSNLVRDLEAAPATERRAITRDELEDARGLIVSAGASVASANTAVGMLVKRWRLTVEDA